MTGGARAASVSRPNLAFDVRFDALAPGLPRRPTLRRWVKAAQERDLAVTLRFVGRREGRLLNGRFRGRDHATNVLTFVYDDVDPLAGDIVLCVPVLAREASSQGKTLRAQMDCVSIDDEPPDVLPLILETKHSRFPVIGESKDDVIGILLAKELLNYYARPEGFVLRDTLRPAVFVPESKRLNVLLREFRANRNHIAIVVDEYGGVSGLVTIEDVLEQIVGDIEGEYDFDESIDNVIPEANAPFGVKAQTEIADFNEHFGTSFEDEEFDTVGGLVLKAFG